MKVIIGTGAAGIAAAKMIRKLAPGDEITMISKDSMPYSRPMLHKYLSKEKDFKGLVTVPDNFFEEMNIRHIPGVNVNGLKPAEKKLVYDGGEIGYDKLLIATGANAVVPPIGDLAKGKNVFCLRDFSDALAIREKAEQVNRVLIIGGGLIGLDAACALLETGKDVTVVEMSARILSLNLDDKAAKVYQDKFEAAGCKFILGAKATGTKTDDMGNVSALMLDSSDVIDCEMLVVAAGVRPAASFLDGSGVVVERGIAVDKYLKTSDDSIYAAGDATGLTGIWPNAVALGEVAAKNMCGQSVEYYGFLTAKNNIFYYRLPSLSIGVINPEEGDEVFCKNENGNYHKVICGGGIVKGVILQGDISKSEHWQSLIKNKTDIASSGKSVWEI